MCFPHPLVHLGVYVHRHEVSLAVEEYEAVWLISSLPQSLIADARECRERRERLLEIF